MRVPTHRAPKVPFGEDRRKGGASPALGLFRMRLVRGLSYRAAAFAGVCTQFFFGFVHVSVLQAFARAGGSPLSDPQIATLVWLNQAFLALIMVWFRDSELVSLICSGDSAYELCRPVDLYGFWFARLYGGRLAALALRALPILCLAALLPEPWRLHLPASPAAALLFSLSLGMGSLLIVAITFFAYIITMVSLNQSLGFVLISPLAEFCSGLAVPLPFLPPALRSVLEALPFRCCSDLPFRIWCGSIPPESALGPLFLEALWLAALVLSGRLALRAALRAHAAPGG